MPIPRKDKYNLELINKPLDPEATKPGPCETSYNLADFETVDGKIFRPVPCQVVVSKEGDIRISGEIAEKLELGNRVKLKLSPNGTVLAILTDPKGKIVYLEHKKTGKTKRVFSRKLREMLREKQIAIPAKFDMEWAKTNEGMAWVGKLIKETE